MKAYWRLLLLLGFRLCALHFCITFQSSRLIVEATVGHENIRSLDSTGHAVQLRHAEAAADIQGRTIIVVRRSNSVWVVRATPTAPSRPYLRSGGDGLLQRITCEPIAFNTYKTTASSPVSVVYAVCTGVQSDAWWLIRNLQAYASAVEERYGTQASNHMAAAAVSTLKRSFWGYDNSNSWTPPSLSALSTFDATDGAVWARPVGVKTILITMQPYPCQMPLIQLVDPSGAIKIVSEFVCMGRHSSLIYQDWNRRKSLVPSDHNIHDDTAALVSTLREITSQAFGCSENDVVLRIEEISSTYRGIKLIM